MAVDLPRIRLQHRLNVVHPIRTLGQNDSSDHRLDVVIRELDVDREPPLKTLQRRGAGERRLSGAHEEEPVAEPLAARFDDLLDDVGAAGVVPDVLLHLVEDDDGARHPAAGGERIVQRVRELVRRDVPRLRELGTESRPRLLLAGRETRVRGEQCPRDEGAHVEGAQLPPEVPPVRLDLGSNPFVEPVLPQPEAEARQWKALRKPGGLEHDAEQGEADAASRPRAERSRGSVQPMSSPAEGRDLPQELPCVVREMREAAGAGPVFGKRVVRPQKAQHLRQVRLAAAEEAADPGGRLLGLALAAEVGLEDPDQPAPILAFAHEVLELEAQGAAFVRGHRVAHGRDAVVEQRDAVGVLPEYVAVLHTPYTPRSSRTVMGTAR